MNLSTRDWQTEQDEVELQDNLTRYQELLLRALEKQSYSRQQFGAGGGSRCRKVDLLVDEIRKEAAIQETKWFGREA